MSSPYTKRLADKFKEEPEFKLTRNRYRCIRYALYENYNDIIRLAGKERMENFLKDVVSVDRKIRMMTEGEEVEEKKVLSQEWQIGAGYEPGTRVLPIEVREQNRNDHLNKVNQKLNI